MWLGNVYKKLLNNICFIVLDTFKLQKIGLQKEGFNFELIKDSMYYYTNSGVYQELSSEAYQDIVEGKIKF